MYLERIKPYILITVLTIFAIGLLIIAIVYDQRSQESFSFSGSSPRDSAINKILCPTPGVGINGANNMIYCKGGNVNNFQRNVDDNMLSSKGKAEWTTLM